MTAPHGAPVRVAVLGPVRAWRASVPVEPGGPRQRTLLARLVLAHGHVVSVDRLIEDLWQGKPPPKALSALQAYISHLRRVLEPDREPRAPATVIVSEAPGYRLQLPEDAVDAWRFDDQVRAAQSNADPEQRVQLLTAALDGWAGEPYAEMRDARWVIAESPVLLNCVLPQWSCAQTPTSPWGTTVVPSGSWKGTSAITPPGKGQRPLWPPRCTGPGGRPPH